MRAVSEAGERRIAGICSAHGIGTGTGLTRRLLYANDIAEIDEFPMNSLLESTVFAKQALRAIDGDENGRQGRDWQQWLTASWYPCSTLMGVPLPITWSIGNAVNPSEPRRTGQPAHPIS